MSKRFKSQKLSKCRICDNKDLKEYLNLGNHPPSNSFIKLSEKNNEQFFPLTVVLCEVCGLSQLNIVVSSEDIFDEYLYLSSSSKALVKHYSELTKKITENFELDNNSLIVDIGCNDGITLNTYSKKKYNLLGIEPSSAAKLAIKSGLNVE